MEKETPKDELCKCGKNKAEPLHPCPYQEEINNNLEPTCNCCADCAYECAMAI